jgi:hypothetical protein
MDAKIEAVIENRAKGSEDTVVEFKKDQKSNLSPTIGQA